jgi:hypothetical protein
MTTVSQVKQITKSLLQRNPDLALVGRLVVIKPVHHILRGILIDYSRHPKLFVPTWSAVCLFEPEAHFHYFWGTQIGGIWELGSPDLGDKIADAIEREALPVLRPITTIEAFVRFANGAWIEDHKSYVDVALGDLQAAQSACDFFPASMDVLAFATRSSSTSFVNCAHALPQTIGVVSLDFCVPTKSSR